MLEVVIMGAAHLALKVFCKAAFWQVEVLRDQMDCWGLGVAVGLVLRAI
jgi:hypothetical protein